MVSRAPAVPLDRAYETCLRLARDHYENFPVASRLLPQDLRPHVAAIYAFARAADDVADEPGRTPEERLRILTEWGEHLHGLAPGTTGTLGGVEVFTALQDTIARFDLPVELLDDLLSAFMQDVTTTRYQTWADVLDYCRRSANPVGRLVLRLTRQTTPDRESTSDAICTALQLTNFWQDFAVDWQRGRLYLPADEWQPRRADLGDLDRREITPAWRAALRASVARTRALFDHGRPLCDAVSGRLRYELRATWLGGTRILDALEGIDFDVFTERPTLTLRDKLAVATGTLIWR